MKPLLTREELADLLSPLEPECSTIQTDPADGQQIIIELGRRTISAQELREIRPGRIILLDKNPEALLEVYRNNQLLACGSLVRIGNKIGIKLTEITDNLKEEQQKK